MSCYTAEFRKAQRQTIQKLGFESSLGCSVWETGTSVITEELGSMASLPLKFKGKKKGIKTLGNRTKSVALTCYSSFSKKTGCSRSVAFEEMTNKTTDSFSQVQFLMVYIKPPSLIHFLPPYQKFNIDS